MSFSVKRPIHALIAMALFVPSISSAQTPEAPHPAAKNTPPTADCVENLEGVVTKITLGDSADDVHFGVTISSGTTVTGTIWAWHHLLEDEGRPMYAFLLSAFNSQAKIHIDTCWKNRLLRASLSQQ